MEKGCRLADDGSDVEIAFKCKADGKDGIRRYCTRRLIVVE